MAIKHLQNKIAESRFALITTSVYALVVILPQIINIEKMWIQVLLLTISTLLMMEFNNANALIRIYSRMVSCSFLALSLLDSSLFKSISGGIFQLFFILFLLLLFKAYQDKKASGRVYYAFLSLGISSLCFVQILLIVPVLWILLFTNALAGSIKTFFASVLGVLTPYWFALGYLLYNGSLKPFYAHIEPLWQFIPLAFPLQINTSQSIVLGFLFLLSLTGIIHFIRNSFLDKIKTRMIYEALIALNVLTFILILLQPQHYNFLIRIFIITSSPLIGHFITLTHTKVTNAVVMLFMLLTVVITYYNLWIQS